MTIRTCALATVFLVAATATAADWPRWRGPNNDGVSAETGLLKQWSKDGPPLAWTAKGLGLGYGTPSVAAGKVFGTGVRDGKDGVWALSEADGKELWFTPFDQARNPSQNNGSGSAPTYHDGKVYVVSALGTLACLDANSGKLLWQKNYLKDFGSRVPIWGFNQSVLVDGDKVVCAPSSDTVGIAALKAGTGEVVWTVDAGPMGKAGDRAPIGGAGYSSPVKATIGGIPMYIALLGNVSGLVGVHAETGKLLWRYSAAAMGGTAQIPTPIVKGDKVWVSSGYSGGSALIQVVPQGKGQATVKEIISYGTELMNHHGGMVAIGDYIYFGRGQNGGAPSCVDLRSGEIVWKKDPLPGGNRSAAYLYADGLLYIRYENGKMFLVRPSPKAEEFTVVSSFQLPEPNTSRNRESWPHPVIANGKLYIRDQNHLYSYDVKATTN